MLTDIGAGIVSITTPDRNGNIDDIVLGYKDEESYFGDGPCAGKTPGRYANRIAKGKFTLNGINYSLCINNGPNHLHGGEKGFSNKRWDILEEVDSKYITFGLISPDGDEGYPGELKVKVKYELTEDSLEINYEAISNADTIINLTNHTYWNLSGENSGSVLEHKLKINSNSWLPTDESLIPTGEIAPVKNSPMDFRKFKTIGQDIYSDFTALKYGKGYDNCWALKERNSETVNLAANLYDEKTGRELEIYTDQPGVQVYTGNWLAGSPTSKSGRSYKDYEGIAIECQNFPDSPNNNNFPSTILLKNNSFHRKIIYKFSIKK